MNRPIFIVGANRSGTTLLRLILNSHSEIAVPDELAFFRGEAFEIGPLNWRNVSMSPPRYECFVRSFLERNAETLAPLEVPRIAEEILSIGGNDIKLPYEYVLRSWAEAHGKNRWGEKTPGNLFYARDVRTMFPDSQFIYMVRDPRGGVLSMKKARIFSTDTVINSLNRHHYMTRGLEVLEREVPPEDRVVVRYEDLLSDPEETVRALCTFLGIRFEPVMLDYHTTAKDFMNEKSSADFNAAANRPIQKHKAETWRHAMSTRDIAIIESICGEDMARHGYEPETSRVSRRDKPNMTMKKWYWAYQMWKHRRYPQYQVMHGFLPRLRSTARAGRSIADA